MMPSVTDSGDTICALATAQGVGAISVIRVSGAKTREITARIAPFFPKNPESHRVYYGLLRSSQSGQAIDEVLISFFQAGRSFTGEETCEIACHGSPSIVAEILRHLVDFGARPARRGEFTFRAFMNGRIDLIQAESVLALIESRSAKAARLALRQLRGDFSRRLRGLLDRLTWVLAQLEANIDFSTEDIVIASSGCLAGEIEKALTEVREFIAGYRQGQIIRNGFQVALIGAPNAGKSSLLNALVGEDRAIVTPVAGTTRDFIEASLSAGGTAFTLIDTAGLRETNDEVERVGVERTLDKIRDVDLVLFVVDAGDASSLRGFEALNSAGFKVEIPIERTAVVINKIDLFDGRSLRSAFRGAEIFTVSASRGDGLDDLRSWLERKITTESDEDTTLVSHSRHFRELVRLRESLERSLPLLHVDSSPDLVALELQDGLCALHEILGLKFDDQVMDRVFSEFCLGK